MYQAIKNLYDTDRITTIQLNIAVTKNLITESEKNQILNNQSLDDLYAANKLTLDDYKTIWIETLQKKYAEVEAAGYTNTDFGITIGFDDNSRNMFAQQLTLINLAEAVGMTPGDQMIGDLNGVNFTFTVEQLKELMLAYGAAYQDFWNTWSGKRTAVLNATTTDDIKLVTWE